MKAQLEPPRAPQRAMLKAGRHPRFHQAGSDALSGAVLAMMGWMAADTLRLTDGLPFLRTFQYALLLTPLLGAVIGLTRLRRMLWVADAALCAAILVIAYTPLIVGPTRGLVRQDPPRRCEAVVVLSSGMFPNGSLVGVQEDRVLRGLELIRQGYAGRLILTRLPSRYPSSLPAVRREMVALGIDAPIDEVGPAINTHAEALAVAALAKQHDWKQLLLVTSPSHSRRARATFMKAGLSVLAQPSAERLYELSSIDTPDQRLHAFRDWIYETAAWYLYRYRHWV